MAEQGTEPAARVLELVWTLAEMEETARAAAQLIRQGNRLRAAAKVSKIEAVVGLDEGQVLARLQAGKAAPSPQAQMMQAANEAAGMAQAAIGDLVRLCERFRSMVVQQEAPPPGVPGGRGEVVRG